jgi:nucleotide-binding universal stress UspA family protein
VGPSILLAAEQVAADLIVVGSRGRGVVTQALFGSTVTGLVQHARVPVAVVPPSDPEIVTLDARQAHPHFGIVLVPVDLSMPSERQLEFAGQLSAGSPHHLLMMHVVAAGQSHGSASAQLTALARSLHTAHGCRVLVDDGDVGEKVLSVVRREKVGVVVLGRSGTTPGRLANALVRHAGAVVIVVP